MKQQLMAALAHNIDTIRIVYDLSLEVEARKLMVPTMEKLANLLEFTICFDKIKSTKPEIQNDLSHFRRLVAVNTASNQLERYTDAPLNALSFFVADHCPMLKVLVRATERCRMKDRSAIPVIAELANSYCASVSNLKYVNERHSSSAPPPARDDRSHLLYDHTSRDGAFCSKSDVKIKRCLKELVRWKQRQVLVGTGPGQLLDAVKYWSLHLKDVSTPEKLHALLDK
uniref:CYRIA/CYRIB Rac1 binding domain-containing protein n=1 Tax=Globisporangium ultimum (strain ATCC 200006 / CBS 805.95 / DAOM BR144) TaxID=431595 RepID=K3W891_GLOUD